MNKMENFYNKTLNDINNKNTKIRVTSAEIIVSDIAKKPYYEIKYYTLNDNKYHRIWFL